MRKATATIVCVIMFGLASNTLAIVPGLPISEITDDFSLPAFEVPISRLSVTRGLSPLTTNGMPPQTLNFLS